MTKTAAAAKTADAIPVFDGFSAKAFTFLKELAAEQNRDWFEAHKNVYEREVRLPLAGLVASLGLALAANGIELNCDPKRALFRIYRDVRFSKDKSPYKTNVGAALTRDGEKMAPGVLYIHIDPEGSFAASGFYSPDPPALEALRRRIVARPADIHAIIARLEKSGFPLGHDDATKRTPRGFDDVTDEQTVELLRLKSLIVRCPLSRAVLGNPDKLIATLVDFTKAAHPLLQFGWAALR